MSPTLAALLPPPPTIDAIIHNVITEISRYAHLAPSICLSAEIIQEAERRRRSLIMSQNRVVARPPGLPNPNWDREIEGGRRRRTPI